MLGVTAEVLTDDESSSDEGAMCNPQDKPYNKRFKIDKLLKYSKAHEELTAAYTDVVNGTQSNAASLLPPIQPEFGTCQQQKKEAEVQIHEHADTEYPMDTIEAASIRKEKHKTVRHTPEHRTKGHCNTCFHYAKTGHVQ